MVQRTSHSEIAREIINGMSRELKGPRRREVKEFAEDVRDYARRVSPTHTGRYAASWHVEARTDIGGMPRYAVVNDDPIAGFIEFGTGPDVDPGSSYGPNTPTPEFAVAARTAIRFGGTSP